MITSTHILYNFSDFLGCISSTSRGKKETTNVLLRRSEEKRKQKTHYLVGLTHPCASREVRGDRRLPARALGGRLLAPPLRGGPAGARRALRLLPRARRPGDRAGRPGLRAAGLRPRPRGARDPAAARGAHPRGGGREVLPPSFVITGNSGSSVLKLWDCEQLWRVR